MFDMFKMLGKLNEVKADAKEVKEELKHKILIESDESGNVQVRVSGAKVVLDINIDDSFHKSADKAELEKTIMEATNNALRAASDYSKKAIKERIDEKYPEIAGLDLGKWL